MSVNGSVSFIIPAYNAANTLENCVNSITVCKDHRIEVIIVEDGSTDQTTCVAEELAASDPRVKLFHSEKGVSNARNLGIEQASGAWIAFVDADDRIAQGKMELLVKAAETSDADLICYGHRKGSRVSLVNDAQAEQMFTGGQLDEVRAAMLEDPTRYMQVWAKLFRKSVIAANGVRFNAELRLAEDSDFTLRCSRFCEKIVLSPECVYEYSLNGSSTMRVMDGSKTKDYLFAMRTTAKAVESENATIQKAFQKYVLMHLNILMVREVFAVRNSEKYSAKYAHMKQIAREDVFCPAIANTKATECTSLRMLPILLLKLKLTHCASLLFALRALQNSMREKRLEER